jgi:hypothetical protein
MRLPSSPRYGRHRRSAINAAQGQAAHFVSYIHFERRRRRRERADVKAFRTTHNSKKTLGRKKKGRRVFYFQTVDRPWPFLRPTLLHLFSVVRWDVSFL